MIAIHRGKPLEPRAAALEFPAEQGMSDGQRQGAVLPFLVTRDGGDTEQALVVVRFDMFGSALPFGRGLLLLSEAAYRELSGRGVDLSMYSDYLTPQDDWGRRVEADLGFLAGLEWEGTLGELVRSDRLGLFLRVTGAACDLEAVPFKREVIAAEERGDAASRALFRLEEGTDEYEEVDSLSPAGETYKRAVRVKRLRCLAGALDGEDWNLTVFLEE